MNGAQRRLASGHVHDHGAFRRTQPADRIVGHDAVIGTEPGDERGIARRSQPDDLGPPRPALPEAVASPIAVLLDALVMTTVLTPKKPLSARKSSIRYEVANNGRMSDTYGSLPDCMLGSAATRTYVL